LPDIYDEADLYSAAFRWPVEEEVDWLLAQAGQPTSVLEPFCGNARYATAFRARGVSYTGIDLSCEMLSRAPVGSGIRVVRADARTFELPGERFPLAWCPVNSIRHLAEEAGVVAHLRSVRRHLAPGGALVLELELVNRDGPWTEPDPTSGVWSEPQPDGSVVHAVWRRESCSLPMRIALERATFRREIGGRVVQSVEHLYRMRIWTHDDLLSFAAATGLRVARIHRHLGPGDRPEVPLSPALENTGVNSYVWLTPR
jgi:SAM-dependent methyltransferase